MSLTPSLAAGAVRTASAVSPRWGARVALPLFTRVSPPRAIASDDQGTMWRADRSTLRIAGVDRRGTEVAVYEWGPSGGEVVVLAHGWDGRASQFAPLVRELVADGHRVVAFDAPAHGASAGRGTYLLDWVHALHAVQDRRGPFAAVIGHSFGGLATLVAVGQGVAADRVVTVAAPADAEQLLTAFRASLGLDERTAAELRARFSRRYFPGGDDPFTTLSPLHHPLPRGSQLLLVHDESDRLVPFTEMARIAAVHPGARILATKGLGHTRILRSDAFLDAVHEFLTSPATTAPTPAAGRAGQPVQTGALTPAG